MKLRPPKTLIDDTEERQLEEYLRTLEPGEPPAPEAAYWQNLLVRTNERIDRATSGRALTISWAARVAIPGVVAVVSFLVALSYYVPEKRESAEPFLDVVRGLPAQAVDSLVLAALAPGDSARVEYVADVVFSGADDQIADYIIERGSGEMLEEYVSAQDLSEVLALLGSTER